jgi:hypothetical protein
MLVKPIPEAATATRFIIAPDAILNLLPFEALRDAQGEYLLKSRVISYVPSGTILNTLRHAEKQKPAPKPLLAVGDVEYENQGGAGRRIPPPASIRGRIERGIADLSGIGLHDLPETRAEVEEIGKIVGSDAVILLGKDATETGFKKQPLDQFRILHLAVHGFADTQYPERSALVLGADPQSDDDGLLQVREIIRLRLNAELTTLSACDSGVGKLQGQEGISNLVEAFLVAGSKSVVASLWSADDTFASALMEQFYRHLAQGEDTSSALRNAKLDLLAKYGDQVSPFYWAAFIAVGETSTPIGIKTTMNLTLDERTKIFDKVCRLVEKKHFNPGMNGVDWNALARSRRDQILACTEPEVFEKEVHKLVAELKTSHTGFRHAGMRNIPARHAINATLQRIGVNGSERWMFQDVHQGGPAFAAGIRPGDLLLECGGREVRPPNDLTFSVGESASLLIEKLNGEVQKVNVQLPMPKSQKHPVTAPQAVTTERLSDEIGLLRVAMFPGAIGIDVAKDIDRGIAALDGCSRLIVDLRGNTGGGIGGLRLMSYLTPGNLRSATVSHGNAASAVIVVRN